MIKSTDSKNYQKLKQQYAVMVKQFRAKTHIEEHHHERDQLLYATMGLMQLKTHSGIWLVPNDRAVFIPAFMKHSIIMLSDVTMRTIYIEAEQQKEHQTQLKVISISPLMRELITALSEEELDYQPSSRGDQLAQLIKLELTLEKNKPLVIPLPKDYRLQKICALLIDNPADNKTLKRLGEICGASERTLSRLFDKELAMSFRRWRQLIRFHHALELLTNKKSIKYVATECGYKSPSAFSAAFQAYVGYAPSSLI